LTVAAALNIDVFHLKPGSSITLAATINNAEFIGAGYTVALGNQDIGGCRFFNGAFSGLSSGSSRVVFRDSIFTGATTLPAAVLLNCNLSATITLSAATTYTLDNCFSGIAGTSAPSIDFGTAVGNTSLNMRHYSGGIQIEAMGNTGTDTMSLEGPGGQFIEGTCTGGTVAIRGNFSVSGITNLTLSEDARIDVAQINAQCDTAISDAGLATASALATVDTEVGVIDGIVDTILIDTAAMQPEIAKMVFTKTNELDVNTKSINDAEVIGDGNATPWDGI